MNVTGCEGRCGVILTRLGYSPHADELWEIADAPRGDITEPPPSTSVLVARHTPGRRRAIRVMREAAEAAGHEGFGLILWGLRTGTFIVRAWHANVRYGEVVVDPSVVVDVPAAALTAVGEKLTVDLRDLVTEPPELRSRLRGVVTVLLAPPSGSWR